MLEVVIVLLLVIFAMVACLTWICIKLIYDRLDTASLERFANGYLDQMGESYCRGFNQRITSDAIPPTGPKFGSLTQPDDWSAIEESEPYIPESETEDITHG